MSSDRWQRVEEIFHQAAELASEARLAFLDEACAGDESLRREVQSLLAHDAESGDTLANAVAQAAEGAGLVEDLTGKRMGLYQITGQVGEGGMGVVYRAVRATDFEKQVAVKLVKRGMDTDSILQRFRHERQILAALDHPNIARLLDGGATEDGRPYLVMEYVEGAPITEYSERHGLDIPARLQLFQAICSAVHYAHQNLVVHRDLKPSHILVTAEGVPKLLDFGIAKLLEADADVTVAALRFMTPECASPEQVRGEAVTTASDVYSLGVLLYHLLTGAHPYHFTTRTAEEITRIICETEPKKPSELRRLSKDLDNIVFKAMDKDPARRYTSAEQFSEDIRRYLAGLPVMARAHTFRYRASKFVRRHKTASVAAGLLALSLMGGMGATLWEAHIAQIERSRAERRFADVREIANSLMFEVHDAVRNLPGSTAARKLIVDRALRYLDKLARESRGDAGLQDELASAYEHLGDVQGAPGEGNLGDSAGALASYRKSLDIRRARAEGDSRNIQTRRRLSQALQSLAKLQMAIGNTAEVLENGRAALAIDQAIHQDGRSTGGDSQRLAIDFEILGDLLGGNASSANLADSQGALDNHRKALEMQEAAVKAEPANVKWKNGIPLYQMKIADDLAKLGRRTEALAYYQRALPWLESRAANPTDVPAAYLLASVYSRIGDTLLMSGDAAGALRHYQAEAKTIQPLALADPKDANLLLAMAAAEANLGNASVRAGNSREGLAHLERAARLGQTRLASDPDNGNLRSGFALLMVWTGMGRQMRGELGPALENYRAALKIFQSLANAQPQDVDSRLNVAASSNAIAGILLKQGKTDEARETYRAALGLAESFAASESGSEAARYTVADAYAGLGSVAAAEASSGRTRPTEQTWREARSWFQRSVAMWGRVNNPGAMSPNGFDTPGPGKVRAELARCDAALNKLASQ